MEKQLFYKTKYFFYFQQVEASNTLHYTCSKATNMATLAVNQNEKDRLYLRSLKKNALTS